MSESTLPVMAPGHGGASKVWSLSWRECRSVGHMTEKVEARLCSEHMSKLQDLLAWGRPIRPGWLVKSMEMDATPAEGRCDWCSEGDPSRRPAAHPA